MTKHHVTPPVRSKAHDVVAHTPRAARKPVVKAATKPAVTTPAQAEGDANGEATFTLSAKTTKLIDGIREPFMSFAGDFAALAATRAQLAPKFMKAFGAYQAESGGSFVSFVRFVDPTVPADREGYRTNNVYQAADYLRRLTAEKAVKDPNAPEVTSPVEVIVDLLVTILPVVDSLDAIWEAFTDRYHWTEKRVARLKKMVGEARTPILVKKPTERRLHSIAS